MRTVSYGTTLKTADRGGIEIRGTRRARVHLTL